MIYDKKYKKVDYTDKPLSDTEFECCTFENCNFSKINLSDFTFIECEFIDCDLSNVNLSNTALQEVGFMKCKLLGMRFDTCKPFLLAFSFDTCVLDYASFYQLKIPNTRFINSSLIEVDFSETDLRKASIRDCNLQGSLFENTIIEEANLRNSYNFIIDPESNYIRKARFSRESILGLLFKYNINVE